MRRLLFGLMYRVGFTPWDGHALPARLRDLAAHPEKGRALDVGCGTGDAAVFLARAGWDVTAVDFVERALSRARSKARAAGVDVRFVRADATELRRAGVGGPFALLLDGGLLHGLGDAERDACVRELTEVAAPGATLLSMAFERGAARGPRGMSGDEVERRFADGWTLVGHDVDPTASSDPATPIHVYELRRR
jgi:SAM-dependent methyltransferase